MRLAIGIMAVLVLGGCATSVDAQDTLSEPSVVTSKVSAVSMFTQDLNASIAFYTNYLGYRVLGQKEITAAKSRDVLGVPGEETVRYASLAPADYSEDRPDFATISFIEVAGAAPSPFDQNPERVSRAGEFVLAHRVTNIEEISRQMTRDGVRVITPLSTSGCGRSMSMAVLDPNGTRVEMYEY